MQVGNLQALLGAMFSNFRPEVRATDFEQSALTNKHVGVIWYNSTSKQYKYFDGTEIKVIGGNGGTTGDFLPLSGGDLTGPLKLSEEQLDPTADRKYPVPYGQYKTDMDKKMNKLTGLGEAAVVVTDEQGNITVSSITAAELAFLSGTSSNIQEQLDNKMSSGDLVLTGDFNAGGFQIINLGAPQGPQYALRQMDLDAAMEGIPVIKSAITIVRDASVVPQKVDGARYLIADKDQIHPDFGTPESLANWCVLQYDAEQTSFYTAWEPSVQASGTMIFIDDKKNYFEYDGTTFSERIKGQAPQSGTGTDVEADGKVNVKVALPIFVDTGGNVTLKYDATHFEADVTSGLKILANSISLDELSTDIFGTGLEVKEGKLIVNIDVSEFIKSGSTVEELKVTKAAVDDSDVVNKKYFDDNAGTGGASSFTYTSTAPALVHTVQHNLNKKHANVTVWIEDAVVQPSSIEATSATTMTVTLPEEKDCVVVVI